MPNPNKNKHFNDEALRINRALKKKIDRANAIVDELLEANEHLQYLHDLKEALKL
jgi:hypothetical protein